MVIILASIFIILVPFAENLVWTLLGVIYTIKPKNVFHAPSAVSLLPLLLVVALYISEGFMFLNSIIEPVTKNGFHAPSAVGLLPLLLAVALYISESFMLLITIILIFCLSGTCSEPFLFKDNFFLEMP